MEDSTKNVVVGCVWLVLSGNTQQRVQSRTKASQEAGVPTSVPMGHQDQCNSDT